MNLTVIDLLKIAEKIAEGAKSKEDKSILSSFKKIEISQSSNFGESYSKTIQMRSNYLSDAKKQELTKFLLTHLQPIFVSFPNRQNHSLEISWSKDGYYQYDNYLALKKEINPFTYNQPSKNVFISHSSKDKKLATNIADFLLILGYSCFVAHSSITGGKNWPDEIFDKLDKMSIFIPIITDNFNSSTYCHQECGYARSLQRNKGHSFDKIKIIPLTTKRNLNPEAMLLSIQALPIKEGIITGKNVAELIKALGLELY